MKTLYDPSDVRADKVLSHGLTGLISLTTFVPKQTTSYHLCSYNIKNGSYFKLAIRYLLYYNFYIYHDRRVYKVHLPVGVLSTSRKFH